MRIARIDRVQVGASSALVDVMVDREVASWFESLVAEGLEVVRLAGGAGVILKRPGYPVILETPDPSKGKADA